MANNDNEYKIIVKWSGKEYEIVEVTENDTVGALKNSIQKQTGVRPERQKLLNLKYKGNGFFGRKIVFLRSISQEKCPMTTSGYLCSS